MATTTPHRTIDAQKAYTKSALMEVFALKDWRTLDEWLDSHGIEPTPGPGRGMQNDLVSGSAILAAVEGGAA